jgi:hypothetical protein
VQTHSRRSVQLAASGLQTLLAFIVLPPLSHSDPSFLHQHETLRFSLSYILSSIILTVSLSSYTGHIESTTAGLVRLDDKRIIRNLEHESKSQHSTHSSSTASRCINHIFFLFSPLRPSHKPAGSTISFIEPTSKVI